MAGEQNPFLNILGMASLAGRLKMMQQRYPQATSGVNYIFKPDAQIRAENGPNYGALAYGANDTATFNSNFLHGLTGPQLDQVIAKETGQATQGRYIKNNQLGDVLMRAWGMDPSVVQRRMQGLGADAWTGDTRNLKDIKNGVMVHGYRSFPTDTFGIEFANALGYNPGPAVWGEGGVQREDVLQNLMNQGILPRGDRTAQRDRRDLFDALIRLRQNPPQVNVGTAAQARPAPIMASKAGLLGLLEGIAGS